MVSFITCSIEEFEETQAHAASGCVEQDLSVTRTSTHAAGVTNCI
jgi:hypothetical protein